MEAQQGFGILGGRRQLGRTQKVPTLQNPQGPDPKRHRCRTRCQGGAQRSLDGGLPVFPVAKVIQHGQAVGKARIGESLHLFRRGEIPKITVLPQNGAAVGCLAHHPPNPPAAAIPSRMRQRHLHMGDNPVVEIGDVQRSVGSKLHVHRAEPGVRSTHQIGHLVGDAGGTTILDAVAIHPAGHHIAQEKIALKLRRPQRFIAVVEAGNGRGSMVVPQHLRRVAQTVVWFAEHGIKPAMDDLINGHRVAVGGEEVAQRIKAEAEDIGLPITHLLNPGSITTEAEGRSAHFQQVSVGALHARLVAHTLPAIKPSVEAPSEVVGEVVGVGDAKGTVEHFAAVGPSVAIGVLKAEHIRDAEYHSPIAERRHGIGHTQAIGKHSVTAGPAVGPKLRQNANHVTGRLVGGALNGIGPRLSYPQPPAHIEAHADRLTDLRLGRHQLNLKAFWHHKRSQRLGRTPPRSGPNHLIEGGLRGHQRQRRYDGPTTQPENPPHRHEIQRRLQDRSMGRL